MYIYFIIEIEQQISSLLKPVTPLIPQQLPFSAFFTQKRKTSLPFFLGNEHFPLT